jgi:flavin reductase (DIM6/NTAB) family NADH-FMN oxidoreductase RutF/uncharacterized protein YciI
MSASAANRKKEQAMATPTGASQEQPTTQARAGHRAKVAFDVQKEHWHPSVLPGQIVLITTASAAGEPNVAPKSWITMAAFAGPVLAFGCNVTHTTYEHVNATGEFVVNIPGEPLAERIWALIEHHGQERLRQAGLTLTPAQKVKPPLIDACVAHLECALESIKPFGEEVLIFGTVLAASIDPACQRGTVPEQYFALRPIFFLENGTYGSLDAAKVIGSERSTEQAFFVVQVGVVPEDGVLVRDHVAFLRMLRSRGCLLIGGPFADEPGGEAVSSPPWANICTGMYVISAPSRAVAEAIAHEDPFMQAGVQCVIKAWTRTF